MYVDLREGSTACWEELPARDPRNALMICGTDPGTPGWTPPKSRWDPREVWASTEDKTLSQYWAEWDIVLHQSIFHHRGAKALHLPLSNLHHWSEVKARAQELSFTVKKGKWQTLCAAKWPTFKTGWPIEGSFHRDLIQRVKGVVFQQGGHSHSGQKSYIMVWIYLSKNPPLEWSFSSH